MGFDPPDALMGWFGYSRDHRDVELDAMIISVMGLLDRHDQSPMVSPAPERFYQIRTSGRYNPDSLLGYRGS